MRQPEPRRTLRVGSLFSGIGGLDLGLEWAGMEVAYHVETEPFCRGVLRRHFPGAKLYGDVNEIDPSDLDPVDLLCGGFPCQGFSLSGQRRGAKDPRFQWPAMLKIIRHHHPTWVLGENVFGIVSLALDGILLDLEAEGYACRTFIVPACAVNAPHRRDRVFIVAHSLGRGFDPWGAPEPGQEGRGPFFGDTGQGDLADAALSGSARLGGISRQAQAPQDGNRGVRPGTSRGGVDGNGLAHAQEQPERSGICPGEPGRERRGRSCDRCGAGHVEHAQGLGWGEGRPEPEMERGGAAPSGASGLGNAVCERHHGREGSAKRDQSNREDAGRPESSNWPWASSEAGPLGFWDNAETILCHDGKARRVKPGVRLLAHGVPGRVARLKALGNAVSPQVAYVFGLAINEAERMAA